MIITCLSLKSQEPRRKKEGNEEDDEEHLKFKSASNERRQFLNIRQEDIMNALKDYGP